MALTPLSLWTPLRGIGDPTAQLRAGIDTISLAFPTAKASELEWEIATSYIDGPDPVPKFRKLRNERITTRPLGGFHFGVFNPDTPDQATAFLEGRLAQLWHPSEQMLASPQALRLAATVARELLEQVGVQTSTYGFGEVRRLDIACDVKCSPAVGKNLLASLARVGSTCDRRIYIARRTQDDISGIVFSLRDQGTLVRIYDKARQLGVGQPYTMIRLERQVRWKKADRPQLRQWDKSFPDLGDLWAARFMPWRGASTDEAIRAVLSGATDGTIPLADARTMAGYLLLHRHRLAPPLAARLATGLSDPPVNFCATAIGEPGATVLDACVAALQLGR